VHIQNLNAIHKLHESVVTHVVLTVLNLSVLWNKTSYVAVSHCVCFGLQLLTGGAVSV